MLKHLSMTCHSTNIWLHWQSDSERGRGEGKSALLVATMVFVPITILVFPLTEPGIRSSVIALYKR